MLNEIKHSANGRGNNRKTIGRSLHHNKGLAFEIGWKKED